MSLKSKFKIAVGIYLETVNSVKQGCAKWPRDAL